LLAALVLTGCGRLFDVNLFVVGEQTALERQVLGTYSELGENLLVYSSVRGVNEEGDLVAPPPATESQQAAYQAMRNRDYNRDDVNLMLEEGVAGEGNEGLLVIRQENFTLPEISRQEALTILEEENADRETLIERLRRTSGVPEDQADQIARIFAGLNRDAAPEGSWIQTPEGEWVRK